MLLGFAQLVCVLTQFSAQRLVLGLDQLIILRAYGAFKLNIQIMKSSFHLSALLQQLLSSLSLFIAQFLN
jgi:hypothetical protein